MIMNYNFFFRPNAFFLFIFYAILLIFRYTYNLNIWFLGNCFQSLQLIAFTINDYYR